MAITWTQNGRRLKATGTITAGTPILLMPAMQSPVMCDRLLIQLEAGATGLGKVYNDVPVLDTGSGTTYPTAAQVPTVCGPPDQFNPGSAGFTGGSYQEDPSSDPYNGLDLRNFALDGTVNGDPFIVDVHLKV